MKKIIAVLLTAAMLIGVCGFSFSASAESVVRGVSDKICELRKCFTKSSDDGLIYAEIYYDTDTIPMTEEEKDDYIFEKCGVRAADIVPKQNMTVEEEQIFRQNEEKYYSALDEFNKTFLDPPAKPFLKQMGIKLQHSGKRAIYHNREVDKYERYMFICLTKSEILRAAALDYVDGIVCLRRVNKNPYRTILFENTRNWDNVYAYTGSIYGLALDDYPGTLITETITDDDGDEYYVVKANDAIGSITFNNGYDEFAMSIDADDIYWGDYYAYRLTGEKIRHNYVIEGFDKNVDDVEPSTEPATEPEPYRRDSLIIRDEYFSYNYGRKDLYAILYDENGEKLSSIRMERRESEYGYNEYIVDVPQNAASITIRRGDALFSEPITDFTHYDGYYFDGSDDYTGHYRLVGFNENPNKNEFVLLDSYGWKDAYVYALDKDGNELTGAFPGEKAERFIGYGGMQFDIKFPVGTDSIVVSNGKGDKTEPITDLTPYHGYSLGTKNEAGDYKLNEFKGYLPEAVGFEHWDQWYEPDPEENIYEEEFIDWSKSKYGETCLDNGYDYDELYTHFDGGEPDWVLIKAKYYHEEPEPILWLRIGGVGGRTIFSGSIQSPFAFGYGVYNVKENKFYGLECFADDPDDLLLIKPECSLDYSEYDGLIEALADSNVGYLTGDVNQDGNVDILDATAIQKYSVNKTDLDDDQLELSDVNSDGVVDVFDATAIQRYAVSE